MWWGHRTSYLLQIFFLILIWVFAIKNNCLFPVIAFLRAPVIKTSYGTSVCKILNVYEVSGPLEIPPNSKGKAHYLKYTEQINKKYKLQKRCRVCLQMGIRRMVRTVCRQCDGEPGFCLGCFEKYHTEVLNL